MFRFGDPGGRMYGTVGTSNANLLAHWSNIVVSGLSGSWSVQSGGGRTTGSSLRYTNTGNSGSAYLEKSFVANQTIGVALGIKWNAAIAFNPIAIVDNGTIQVDVRVAGDGSVSLTRNGTSLGSYAAGLLINQWYHFELKVKIASGTSGTYDLWINGVNRITSAGANTQASGNAFAGTVRVGAMTISINAWTIDFDDIIVYDGQTTDPAGNADITGPIGDCGLVWLPPSGAGTTTQLTSNGGANYGQLIDSSGPDGDTTYVESATVNNLDTYAMTDLPGNVASVKSIAEVLYARKTDVGSRGMSPVVRTGGTNYVHATEIPLSDSYSYQFRNWGTNPNTLAAWTVSDINGLEAGQKITS